MADIPIVQSLEIMRRQINARLADLALAQPGYGAAFPADAPDGKLFTKAGTLYQLQAGIWVAV